MSNSQPTFNDRASLWAGLQQDPQHWDMVIVGGGIIGAGVLRELADILLRMQARPERAGAAKRRNVSCK